MIIWVILDPSISTNIVKWSVYKELFSSWKKKYYQNTGGYVHVKEVVSNQSISLLCQTVVSDSEESGR